MMQARLIAMLSAWAALTYLEPAQAAGNAQAGQRLFQSMCATCHVVTAENKPAGPHLAGIIGRKAGSVVNYRYSEALADSAIVWDEKTLNDYLANPKQVVPSTTKAVNVPSAQIRLDLIEYLKTIKTAE